MIKFYKILIFQIASFCIMFFNFILNFLPLFLKQIYLKFFLKKFSICSFVDYNLYIRNPKNIELGKNISINYGCSFFSSLQYQKEGIVVKDNVTFSPGVKIYSITQNYRSKKFENVAKKVIINSNVWICANSIILPGVEIGENSIIGAGSLVNKNIPANQMWAGVPTKFIKKI